MSSMLVTMLPDTFTDPATEYEALTHATGIIDRAVPGVLRLRGKDRVRFLNAMVTNDVAKLAPGHACAALITTTKGKIIAELLVLMRADELVVLVLQGPVARVMEALDSHIIADDVELENAGEQFGVIAVEGPKCRELVWRLFPREPLPMEAFAFTENEYQGLHATVIRHSVVGDKGMLLLVPRAHHDRLLAYLAQGAVGLDGAEIGRAAWNARRMEKGRPWFGTDVTEENFPAECGLESHVNYEKGCYLGQETIARMHYRGHPNWKLVGLAGGAEVPAPGAELVASESAPAEGASTASPAGRITSAVFSPALKRALCLGYVRAPLAVPGAEFSVREGGRTASLTIVELPLKGDPPHA
jgi:folate-binding protein YgfZ